MTGNRLVTIPTVDHGLVAVPEPAWCTGHGWQPNPYLADVTHNSARVRASAATAAYGLVEVMRARITHAPYAVLQPEPHPLVSVRLDVALDLDPADALKVVQGLRVAALRLEKVAAEAARLRGERL
ncbi:DUF6907 domain-containing protein [Streptomyces cavernae]|uniref:DUF6907 domain-containing protein n=1 Tax=Streptomyces cavernae TaxID=2259034 RepID=UPI000FEBE66E|nr:hypothetical protein [Streptomyces cavernae]